NGGQPHGRGNFLSGNRGGTGKTDVVNAQVVIVSRLRHRDFRARSRFNTRRLSPRSTHHTDPGAFPARGLQDAWMGVPRREPILDYQCNALTPSHFCLETHLSFVQNSDDIYVEEASVYYLAGYVDML